MRRFIRKADAREDILNKLKGMDDEKLINAIEQYMDYDDEKFVEHSSIEDLPEIVHAWMQDFNSADDNGYVLWLGNGTLKIIGAEELARLYREKIDQIAEDMAKNGLNADDFDEQ